MYIVTYRITRSSMEPVVSLFVAVFITVLDLGAGRNPTFTNDWNAQDASIKHLVDGGGRGRNMSTLRQFSPYNESVIKYHLVTPSPLVIDVNHSTEKNDLEPKFLPYRSMGSEETGGELKYKPSSHLRLHKTNDKRIVIMDGENGELWRADKSDRSSETKSTAGLQKTFDEDTRQTKNGKMYRNERFLQDSKLLAPSNRDFPVYNNYPDGSNEETGHRYYYNDFDSGEHYSRREEIWRPLPGSFANRGGHHPVAQRRYHAGSCRKYLEFLKYAFEQLDTPSKSQNPDDQDDYSYYDDDYVKPEPKMLVKSFATKSPPVITPDMTILHRMAVSSLVDEATPVVERRSSEVPVKSSSVSPKASSPLNFDVLDVRSETESTPEARNPNATSSKPIGSTSGSTPKKKGKSTREDCEDKLFPCPDNINVTYPVNGYCNRFVACEAGKPHPEFCQDGLHFNLVEKQCDLPHNSFCTYSCPTAEGYLAVPGDCGGFFRCSNWYPEYRLCPPRMHWDNKAKICTFEELSSCPVKCNTPYEVKPYEGVCNAYIICTRNIPRFHQCPDGYHFGIKQLRCIPKLLSNCTNSDEYIARNRGLENGKKALCADIDLGEGGKTRWCQESFEEPKTN